MPVTVEDLQFFAGRPVLEEIAVGGVCGRVRDAAPVLFAQPIERDDPELDPSDLHPFMVIRDTTIPVRACRIRPFDERLQSATDAVGAGRMAQATSS